MALFVVGQCLLQVIITDCSGRTVPDLEEIMKGLLAMGAIPQRLSDCDVVARLVKRAVMEATGCEAVAEPFHGAMGPEMHRVMALRLG
ncbi:hypothetical protein [Pyrodictium abyssi]|uniref:Uncharacterized protein n=1 Tax=Pyrodictium abyssi TaxID=54256 RepID=A0ABN6ZQW3_9CREN|nr:hypothetical protein PABY_21570 [Pyrodictium abyssi]